MGALIVLKADWGRLSHDYFNPTIARQLFPDILTIALKNTAIYTAMGFVFGLGLWSGAGAHEALRGRALQVGGQRLYRVLPRHPAAPVAVLPRVRRADGHGCATARQPYSPIVLGLGMPAAAYMAETIRAGIQAVPRGAEAARSLGMSHGRAMVSIVIPQAFRIIVPPLTNEVILLTKDSSLVAILGVMLGTKELTKFGRDSLNQLVNPTPLVIAGFCYLLITVPLSLLVRRLETHNNRAR